MKIGVAGTGHLGKIHLKCLKKTKFEIAGFYDPNPETAEKVSLEFGMKAFGTLEDLINSVDCLDIVSPTPSHYQTAAQAIRQGRHVFIEKPLTETIGQAEELVSLAQEKNVVVQVGHVERYNPAIRSLQNISFSPRFIEAHRLATFNPRGTDVSVVLDLMIHDIDIVLHLIREEITDVRANGVCIVSSTPDICNARIEFANGAVANLTASRISMKNMRKIRIFQDDAYISLDFLDKQAQVIKIEDHVSDDSFSGMTIHTNEGLKRITIETPEIMLNNAIEDELNDFYQSVTGAHPVTVTIQDGLKALKLAHLIEQKMKESK